MATFNFLALIVLLFVSNFISASTIISSVVVPGPETETVTSKTVITTIVNPHDTIVDSASETGLTIQTSTPTPVPDITLTSIPSPVSDQPLTPITGIMTIQTSTNASRNETVPVATSTSTSNMTSTAEETSTLEVTSEISSHVPSTIVITHTAPKPKTTNTTAQTSPSASASPVLVDAAAGVKMSVLAMVGAVVVGVLGG